MPTTKGVKIILALTAASVFGLLYANHWQGLTLAQWFGNTPRNDLLQQGNGTATPDVKTMRLTTTDTMQITIWTTNYGRNKTFNLIVPCSGKMCHFSSNRFLVDKSHAVLFHGWREDMPAKEIYTNLSKRYEPVDLPPRRFRDQYWILYMLEPPMNFRDHMQVYDGLFNWTLTYRRDSDVYSPYGKFRKLDKSGRNFINVFKNDGALHPKTKPKLVAQLVSNCRPVPSHRAALVNALQKHIPVDVYGNCGTFKCPENATGFKCKEFLGRTYKFYLAFENSLCQDYVTEKFFHAFDVGMVPIVYGGANYDLIAPRGSYINVNSFPSAKALAQYLLYLNANDAEYLKFFDWWKDYQFRTSMNPAWYCHLCRKLHEDYPQGRESVYKNMTDWLYTNNGRYPVCNEPIKW